MEFIKFFGILIGIGLSTSDTLKLEQLAVQTAEQGLLKEGKYQPTAEETERRISIAREQLSHQIVREIEKGVSTESVRDLLLKHHDFF